MRRKDWTYVAILVTGMLVLILVQVLSPAPVDWRESYEGDDDRPFGNVILTEVLPEVFPGGTIETVWGPPYLRLLSLDEPDVNYLFVTSSFEPDPVETDELLAFVEEGGVLFVAAYYYGDAFGDTLSLSTDWYYPLDLEEAAPIDVTDDEEDDTLHINFVSPSLRRAVSYRLSSNVYNMHFDHIDSARAVVLGVNEADLPNLVRYEWGDGALYLSTLPQAFTNYTILDEDGADYVFAALSYLPDRDVLWDEHYKPLRGATRTPLRFILSEGALRWAYWVGMLGLLLFIGFEARRRQRIIPVIEPLRNTTLDFVETIGRLYYQHSDHLSLARKKITYLLDYIRTHLNLPTAERDEAFLRRVSERSGVPREHVDALFGYIDRVEQQPRLTTAELERLSTLIERFYQMSRR